MSHAITHYHPLHRCDIHWRLAIIVEIQTTISVILHEEVCQLLCKTRQYPPQGATSGQRQWWKTPNRNSSWYTTSVCVEESTLYTDSVLVDLGIDHRPLFSIGAQAICKPLKICHGRSQIIKFWMCRFGGRNFAGGRQGATPGPDSDYAECEDSGLLGDHGWAELDCEFLSVLSYPVQSLECVCCILFSIKLSCVLCILFLFCFCF